MGKLILTKQQSSKAEEYMNSLNNYLSQIKRDLLIQEQNQIMYIYNKAYKDMVEKQLEKCNRNPGQIDRITKSYIKQLHTELDNLVTQYNKEISQEVLNLQQQIMYIFFDPMFPEYKNKVDNIVNITNRRIIEQMIKGNIYKDNIGLSNRLWSVCNASGTKLNDAIMSCIAQGQGAAEISKTIKEFAMGGHHTWSRNKIKEKLGPGYARKYSSGLDYEALRLARTTLTHQAQIAVINSNKINPYLQFIKWHSEHQAGRTCQQCIDRDGQLFPIDEVPLDHPNGMCWIQPVYSIDGKTEATPEEIAKDMKAWAQGQKNSNLMNTIPEYQGLAGTSKQGIASAIPKKVIPQCKSLDEVNKYIDEELLQYSDYKSLTTDQVKSILQSRGITDLNSLSAEDLAAYQSYIGTANSFQMNRHLYTGQHEQNIANGNITDIDKQIQAFARLIGKSKLEDSTKLNRYTSPSIIIDACSQLGIETKLNKYDSFWSIDDNTVLQLHNQLAGKTFNQKSFTSTSYDTSKNIMAYGKAINVEIYAEKGAKGLYTLNEHESEIVLQMGAKFEILGIQKCAPSPEYGPVGHIKLILKLLS